MLIFVAQLFI